MPPQTNFQTEHSVSTIPLRQPQGEKKEAKQDYVFNMDLFKDINEMDDEDYLNGMDKIIEKPQPTVVKQQTPEKAKIDIQPSSNKKLQSSTKKVVQGHRYISEEESSPASIPKVVENSQKNQNPEQVNEGISSKFSDEDSSQK